MGGGDRGDGEHDEDEDVDHDEDDSFNGDVDFSFASSLARDHLHHLYPFHQKHDRSSPGDTGGGRSIWGRGRGSGAAPREEDQVTLGRIIKMDMIMKMHAFKVGIHGKAMLMILIWHHVDDR